MRPRVLSFGFAGTVLCLIAALPLFAATSSKSLDEKRGKEYAIEGRYPVYSPSTSVMRLANRTVGDWIGKERKRFIAAARKARADGFDTPGPFTLEVDYSDGQISPSRLVSVSFLITQYTGGAHPNSYFQPFTFALVGGKAKRMQLRDFFEPGTDFRSIVNKAVIAQLKDDERATMVHEGTFTEMNVQQLNRFVVEKGGLTFLFDRYELAAYVNGIFEVEIPAEQLGPGFRSWLLTGKRPAKRR